MNCRFATWALIFAATAGLATMARAEDAEEPPIKIVLHPAAEPREALKYRLLPPLYDRHAGNAAIHYLKVPHEQTHLFSDTAFWDTIDKWSEMPLAELRKEASGRGAKYAWVAAGQSSIIDFLDRGARCDSCDWGIPIHDHEFYSILLPDVQSSRSSGRILCARARLQIAAGKYTDAIHTLQTSFALGRHVAEGPTLINGLVGAAIAGMTAKQVEALIQQPDCPNLYWALAALPRPLIDFRPGYDAEFSAIYLWNAELRDLEHKDYPPDQWRQLLQRTISEFGGLMPPADLEPKSDLWRLRFVPMLLEGYPRAKRFLISQGRSAAEVEAMPAAQVILLDTMQTYDELRDNTFKWLALPYPEARQGLERAEKRLRETAAGGREIIPLASFMLPALSNVKKVETRTPQKIAVLEIFEALRIYAAAHEGKLPETLADITEVPIPLDPFRNEPFIYVRHGDTARLESPYPTDVPLRYEIRMTAKGDKP